MSLRRSLQGKPRHTIDPRPETLTAEDGKKPFIILVAGVNGTALSRPQPSENLAKRLTEGGAKVTPWRRAIRSAPRIEQLKVWAERASAQFVATKPGGDAAGLAFEALEKSRTNGSDILLIDTA